MATREKFLNPRAATLAVRREFSASMHLPIRCPHGGAETVCSKHRTMRAAIKAALACERRGGAKHVIWEVREHSILHRLPVVPPAVRSRRRGKGKKQEKLDGLDALALQGVFGTREKP